MENTGYKEIEDYVDYDAYNMIGARAKKLPNGDKNFDDLVEMLDYYNDEWDVKSEESFQHPLIFVPFFSLKIPSDTLNES